MIMVLCIQTLLYLPIDQGKEKYRKIVKKKAIKGTLRLHTCHERDEPTCFILPWCVFKKPNRHFINLVCHPNFFLLQVGIIQKKILVVLLSTHVLMLA